MKTEEAIGHKTVFTRSMPQGYPKLIDNLQRVGKLITQSKQDLKRGSMQTAKTTDSPQGVNLSEVVGDPLCRRIKIDWILDMAH